MELVICFTIRLDKMLFINFFKIVKIVWIFGVNTFVYSEKLAVFLDCKGMGTMGTAWTVYLIVGATQLYGKREVIDIFLCKNLEISRKIKVLTIVKI